MEELLMEGKDKIESWMSWSREFVERGPWRELREDRESVERRHLLGRLRYS